MFIFSLLITADNTWGTCFFFCDQIKVQKGAYHFIQTLRMLFIFFNGFHWQSWIFQAENDPIDSLVFLNHLLMMTPALNIISWLDALCHFMMNANFFLLPKALVKERSMIFQEPKVPFLLGVVPVILLLHFLGFDDWQCWILRLFNLCWQRFLLLHFIVRIFVTECCPLRRAFIFCQMTHQLLILFWILYFDLSFNFFSLMLLLLLNYFLLKMSSTFIISIGLGLPAFLWWKYSFLSSLFQIWETLKKVYYDTSHFPSKTPQSSLDSIKNIEYTCFLSQKFIVTWETKNPNIFNIIICLIK